MVVNPGESIQMAIDAAEPNTTIVVAGGVHAEQLTISTDGLTLIGRDTQLVPPPVAVPNLCSGVAGPAARPGRRADRDRHLRHRARRDVPPVHGPLSPSTRSGARSARCASPGSTSPGSPVPTSPCSEDEASASTTTTSPAPSASACSVTGHATPASPVTGSPALRPPTSGTSASASTTWRHPSSTDNDIAGQLIGICVATTGADVADNRVHDNCVGMYVDPGVGATITRNHIFDNNECDLSGSEFGRGITMAGAIGTVVRHNLIEGHHAADGAPAVRITDDVGGWHTGTGTVATRNVVTNNTIVDNTLDLVSTATGHNRITHNVCTSSIPANLCD